MVDKEKVKCRFHPPGKCPKSRNRNVPAPLITGQLNLNKKTYSAQAMIRLARIKSDCCKINADWMFRYEKHYISLIRKTSDGLYCIVNNFNPRFYSPDEIMPVIQNTVDSVKSDEDMVKLLSQKSRLGLG